jgi:hypothetical protein
MTSTRNRFGGNHRQRGITTIAVVLIVIIIAFVALISMRIIPIYLEYFSIVRIIDDVANESTGKTPPSEIALKLSRRFDIDYVTVIKAKDIKVIPKGATRNLELVYEDRRPLIANLDIVAKFQKTVTLNP